jgi:thiol-disulfide isomerase/thioredoxin
MFALFSFCFAAPEMIPEDTWAAIRGAEPATASLEIPLDKGGTFRMAEQKGKKVLLSFWASWCTPCRKELPALSTWAKAHPDVVILAVNVDRTRDQAQKFLDSVHFDLPVAFDPDAGHLGAYGVTSMPTMFLFDGRGELVWRHSGYGEAKGFSELDTALAGAK